MSQTDAVTIHGLTKTFSSNGYKEVKALDEVSLTIQTNEFFTLLGPSGCGKTTLLRIIGGFEPPDSGQVQLFGQDITLLPPNKRPINTVFQNYALFPHMTVAKNIAFGPSMQKVDETKIQETVKEMLRLVRLEGYENRKPSELSGGQQQRVALARALANHPQVLLLDEPLSALDFKLRKEMQLELKRLQRETGITFIFVTHDQEEALGMSDRIAVMNEGIIEQIGTPVEIYQQPCNRFVADFIGTCNFVKANELNLEGINPEYNVAFRPENVSFAEDIVHAVGSIFDMKYQGDFILYGVDLSGGSKVFVRDNANSHKKIGEKVGLQISPQRWVFAE